MTMYSRMTQSNTEIEDQLDGLNFNPSLNQSSYMDQEILLVKWIFSSGGQETSLMEGIKDQTIWNK